ncbi:MCE family protein [Nocardioides pacificus]
MITRRTKVQLVIFVIITLVGVSYVGAKYARLDRLLFDDAYTVVAHFERSGGIFTGAEVSYRGVRIGEVEKMVLTEDGVDVHLGIDNEHDEIPSDTVALVGNRSAVGEQYVELQPEVDDGPFLENDSEIPVDMTRTPIATEKLLTDLSNTVNSVDREDLQTVVTELGIGFDGTGEDLQQIIDTGNSFIETADENFELTTELIRDSNTVLNTQLDSAGSIRSFARDLSLFSGALAGSDADLRSVIDNGSATANQLRRFLEDNEVDLASLINNLVTTGEIVIRRLDGVEQLLAVYPYVVEGGFTVVAKDPRSGMYDAHFGLVLTTEPEVCHAGYEVTDTRPPQNLEDRPMVMNARCTEPPTQSNARGASQAPRAGAEYDDAPVVARVDPDQGEVRWGSSAATGESADAARPGTFAPRSLGEESWKWLLLHPLTQTRK